VIRSWRVVKSKHAFHAFDGEGSRLYGSRWNSPGVKIVHVSKTLSLAILEIIAHLQSSAPLPQYVVFTAEFDISLVDRVMISELPAEWRASPPPSAVQQIGDLWVRRASSAVLEVPSALIPHERNYLLNPAHSAFPQVVIGAQMPIDIDSRVFR
jgi:RES domain-containing protein